jgi:predicted nucleic acid-binding protein
VTVFERLRGYRQAIRSGKPFQRQLQAFEALVGTCVVLPFDQDAADVAATIWSACSRRERQRLGDLLIAAIAVARQIPLATRNRRDFEAFSKSARLDLRLVDWTAAPKRTAR